MLASLNFLLAGVDMCVNSIVGGSDHGRLFMRARVNRCILEAWILMHTLVTLMHQTESVIVHVQLTVNILQMEHIVLRASYGRLP